MLAMGAGKGGCPPRATMLEQINAYTEALPILPGDKDAASATCKNAQQGKATADAEAKRKADEAKRHDDFTKLMAQGQAAMKANRLDDAVKLFGDAAKQDPTDPGAWPGGPAHDATLAMQAVQAAKAADVEKKKRSRLRGGDGGRPRCSEGQAF